MSAEQTEIVRLLKTLADTDRAILEQLKEVNERLAILNSTVNSLG